MKIPSSRPVGAGARSGGVGAARATGAATAASSARGAAPVVDSAEVLGIPASEFTPKVRAAIVALLKEVESLRQELAQSHARISHLEKLADQDALVPVANRRAFVRELSRMLSYAQRYDSEVSVLYFDINDMKRINDTHGHGAGDAAIAHVAAILADSVRESDVVGRLGGDEFGIILANASEEAARSKAESLVRTITSTPVSFKGVEIPVSVTYGAYSLKGGADADAVLEGADRAMYQRKSRHAGTSAKSA